MAREAQRSSNIPGCDAYFESVQSKKKLPFSVQESLTSAFAHIPASSFPQVPGGKGTPICANRNIWCLHTTVPFSFDVVFWLLWNNPSLTGICS